MMYARFCGLVFETGGTGESRETVQTMRVKRGSGHLPIGSFVGQVGLRSPRREQRIRQSVEALWRTAGRVRPNAPLAFRMPRAAIANFD